MTNRLTKKQLVQEEQFVFPYHYIDLKAEVYQIYSIEYLTLLKIIIEKIRPFNGQTILDVGCGEGRLCYELKKEKVKIVGVDFSEKAIAFARAFCPEVKFIVSDLAKLDINKKFDYIIFMETLEHIPPKNIPKILNKLYDLLKENGTLILTVPSTNLPLQPKHYQHFSESKINLLLKPRFKVSSIIGYSKVGPKRKIFYFLQRIALILYLFKNRLRLFNRFLKFLYDYYRKNLATGQTAECFGMLILAVKKQDVFE